MIRLKKSPVPYEIPLEVYINLFDVLKHDLLLVVEDSSYSGNIFVAFNSLVLDLIPKYDNLETYVDFIPISLCNTIYNIIAKIISWGIKPFLFEAISSDQNGFLQGRQMHEAIGVYQGGLQYIKTNKLKAVVIKKYFSKAYDQVS